MKNKIKKMKKITLIITILILSVIFLSGTFARYASSASGTDSTMVAKWSFEVNGKDITVLGDDEIVSFDLFDTIYDSDGESNETDVKEGMIAPGTAGAFEFLLHNTSEVTTSYELGIKVCGPSGRR